MNLTTVTFTGADDETSIDEMVRIQTEYPHVEWGVLFSSNIRAGSRFPSPGWVGRLRGRGLRLSAHLCGQQLEYIYDNALFPLRQVWDMFQRAQLNFHGVRIAPRAAERIREAALKCLQAKWEIIVQLDGVNDWILNSLLGAGAVASGLYDRSHGAGEKPADWPEANPYWSVGYAGGLGPENIAAELPRIAAAAGDRAFWIDMETHVRTNGRFDLQKCVAVLETVRKFVTPDTKG